MASKSIEEWARSHGFSRGFFYLLKKRGIAPRIFNVGAAVRISDEADAEWVRQREAEAVPMEPSNKIKGLQMAEGRRKAAERNAAANAEDGAA
jgi:hypothetical protein